PLLSRRRGRRGQRGAVALARSSPLSRSTLAHLGASIATLRFLPRHKARLSLALHRLWQSPAPPPTPRWSRGGWRVRRPALRIDGSSCVGRLALVLLDRLQASPSPRGVGRVRFRVSRFCPP